VNVIPFVDPDLAQPWALVQEPDGVWRALIHLRGEWIALGYFGAREDAEETIAACLHPGAKLEVRAQ
jgi:hypothetical protein